MGRAIVIACAVLLLGGAGCTGEPEDTAEPVDRPAPTEAVVEEQAERPETTTTTRPRPTTTTSTTTTTTAPPTTTTTTMPPTTTTTTAPPTTTTTTAAPEPAPGGCDPNYTGCVPIASDVDCAGGSGNGPAYVDGPVSIVGSDIYDLDGNDNDGIACES